MNESEIDQYWQEGYNDGTLELGMVCPYIGIKGKWWMRGYQHGLMKVAKIAKMDNYETKRFERAIQ